MEYYYDVLGRLTNITERSGPGGNIHYSMRSNERTGNRFLAALARMPAEDQGSMAGVLLSGIAVLLLMRRLKFDVRWLQCVAPWLASQNLTANPRRLTRGLRLRGPGMFWQVCTAIVIICLLGSDPRLDFWSAHAECANPTNSSSDDVRLTYFDYDLEGHLKQVNCPEGVINYGYDEATGRHINTCTANNEVGYQYDELGRLEHVTVLKRNGTVTNEVTTYTYTDVGSRASVIFPNGVITTNRYDSLNRLTNVTHSLGGTNLLASYSYGLHSTGRRTNAVEILKQEDGNWQTNTLTWSYDAMYRLTNEVSISSLGASGTYTNSYRYDKVGNRLSKTHYQNAVTTLTTNSFNENDQLLIEITLTNSVATATNLYAYDANGSLISKTNIASGGTSAALYGYDLKNKLTRFTNYPAAGLTVTASYVYNDQGIRVRSTENGSPRHYLIDANNHTGYAQILEEMATPHSTATLSYIIGDDVLAQASSSASSYFLYDGHGSTRQLASGAGTVSSRYNYDAYGISLDTSSTPSETTLKYCGEQFDASLGMYNLRARYYNPLNGRFNQRDTFNGRTEDPASLHKYLYCGQDPLNQMDPTGNFTMVELMITIAIITLAVALLLGPVSSALRKANSAALQNKMDQLLKLSWTVTEKTRVEDYTSEDFPPAVGSVDVASPNGLPMPAGRFPQTQGSYRGDLYTAFITSANKQLLIYNGHLGNGIRDQVPPTDEGIADLAALVQDAEGSGGPPFKRKYWYCAFAGKNVAIYKTGSYYQVDLTVFKKHNDIDNTDGFFLFPSAVPEQKPISKAQYLNGP